ncbi:MAG: glycine cleavage system protein GcvH [Saprospiraceae bacterium]|nr:glycine cleavage system protein GcvH [Saprospiraceae bacterium]
MQFPDNLKYTSEHEWVRLEDPKSDGKVALVGITDFAQSELGELVYVEVDTIGQHLEKDKIFGTVEAVKTTSELFMPVSGKILEFNPALDENDGDNPGLINEDPYGEGWIVKIELDNTNDLNELFNAKAYEEMIS